MNRRPIWQFAVVSLAALVPVAALAAEFRSPDGSLVAIVSGGGKNESSLEIKSSSGVGLAGKSYASADGNHGWVIDHGEWTPDSRFFVFSMRNSGGHQSWHSPIEFFSRNANAIESVERHASMVVTDPDFHIIAPSVLEVLGRRKSTEQQDRRFRIDLDKLQ